jgi:hypothetical protein
LRRKGKLEEAIGKAKKTPDIEREIYRGVHEDVGGSLDMLAEMHEEREAWDAEWPRDADGVRRGGWAATITRPSDG